jgi:MHS family proline/betaine transporter-like MFS transporter
VQAPLAEWYDFFVYAFLSVTIARVFFPTGSELSSVLLAVATFGVGFVMRPVGAAVLGAYADRVGRKAALTATIGLMALGTALIALAPTYQAIGVWAPLLVVISRLLQGFSCGGELGGATAILIESAPAQRRGLYASLQLASQDAAFVLGSLVTLVVTTSITPARVEAGGWRWPFLVGVLIVPVGLYIRCRLVEPELFLKSRREVMASPLTEAVKRHARPMLAAVGVSALYVVAPYVLLLYMPTFAVRQLGLPATDALIAGTITGCVSMGLCPIVAVVSDRVGRKPLLLAAALLMAMLTYPAFELLVAYPSTWTVIGVQLATGVLLVMYSGPALALLGELFPTHVRSTAVALAYSLAVAALAGFAQAIVTWLIAATGNGAAPAFYVTGAAVISLAALWNVRDRFREPLR